MKIRERPRSRWEKQITKVAMQMEGNAWQKIRKSSWKT
jgi:hypothetical protein